MDHNVTIRHYSSIRRSNGVQFRAGLCASTKDRLFDYYVTTYLLYASADDIHTQFASWNARVPWPLRTACAVSRVNAIVNLC